MRFLSHFIDALAARWYPRVCLYTHPVPTRMGTVTMWSVVQYDTLLGEGRFLLSRTIDGSLAQRYYTTLTGRSAGLGWPGRRLKLARRVGDYTSTL